MAKELMLILWRRPVGNGVGETGTVGFFSEKGTMWRVGPLSASKSHLMSEDKDWGPTLRIGCLKLDVGWDGAMLQGHNGFDDAGDARAPFRVANVWLD
jgi:hypothetical protein